MQSKGKTKLQDGNKRLKITIKTSKKKGGARVWNKAHYCVYCEKAQLKIGRHLERKHCDEKDVAHAFSFPVGSKERKTLLEGLRRHYLSCYTMFCLVFLYVSISLYLSLCLCAFLFYLFFFLLSFIFIVKVSVQISYCDYFDRERPCRNPNQRPQKREEDKDIKCRQTTGSS